MGRSARFSSSWKVRRRNIFWRENSNPPRVLVLVLVLLLTTLLALASVLRLHLFWCTERLALDVTVTVTSRFSHGPCQGQQGMKQHRGPRDVIERIEKRQEYMPVQPERNSEAEVLRLWPNISSGSPDNFAGCNDACLPSSRIR
ncbi:hypothetical protein GALMADRAFT_240350 [Galerina marginata CBS 339.88]|uniref:Uncharacterized protein n=1 Tax=Galerina marginata (strain CBS 339.88) TaxID=685588 RepID=A0A067TQ13_GALM3|nr:hypothetical protein GALMADRAFT_240350 [Galerina marginata CBS 339.88]